MTYFDKIEGHKSFIKILLGIIVALLLVNIISIKALISLSSNKVIDITVPNFMDSGAYRIGATFASPEVHKMWSKVWLNEIGSFSYGNVRQKYANIYPFLDPQTIYKSKSDLEKFIEFVEENYLTQSFQADNIITREMAGGYTNIVVTGILKRHLGNSEDQLSGLKYSYEFLTYVRNGQIYIKNIKTSFYAAMDIDQERIISNNKFVNFDETLK